jgi:hypothetical protein
MESIIAHKPHLTARTVTSFILQVLLVVLLRQPHQDAIVFNAGLLVLAVLAMAPLCVSPTSRIRPQCKNLFVASC